MKINLIRGQELTREDARLWSSLQEADAAFASPYFSAEYTRAVASVRDDVFVGVLEERGRTVGFFPFQRDAAGNGLPVGGKLSDYQGVVTARGVRWTAEELLGGCGLSRWEFNHLLVSQRPFHQYHARRTSSPAIDLSDGSEAYALEQSRRGSHAVRKVEALRRKLEGDRGTLRYVMHAPESDVLRDLLNCKSAQYRRWSVTDIFSYPWVVNLMQRIHASQREEFAGMLSALYAGDELVAAHMGMRSRTVWHYWFPCFRREFAQYSPGLVLLLEMIRSAELLGIKLIDFGRGDNLYKQRFMNTAIPIAEGVVTVSSSSFAPVGALVT